MKSFRNALILGVAAIALSGCGVLGGLGLGKGEKKPKTAVLGQRIAILTSESDAELDPSLADVAVLIPDPQENADWPQPGGNENKVMENVALGKSIGPTWSAKIAGTSTRERLAAAPVVAEGKVFVVDTAARLHAFDAKTGAEVYNVPVGSGGKHDDGSLFGGGVSYDGGRLFATNGLGDVAAFTAVDGKQVWKVRPAGPLRGAPTVANGNVYVMSNDNQIIALAGGDGSTVWTAAGSVELSGIFGVGAPAAAQGTVVAGFSSGELNAYRYENGRDLWGDALSRTSISTSVASLTDLDASPVIDRGRVYAIGQGGRMVSMELVTGQRLWEINVAGISTPWVSGEWIFVIDDEARLLCIARSNGKVRWISQLPRYKGDKAKNGPITWTGPVLAGGRLIVGSSQGQLANIDPADGKLQSVTKAGAPMYLPPVVAGGTMYILTNDGHLTAWR